MEKDIARMLLKDKRARKTMRERIIDLESYYCIQDVVTQHIAQLDAYALTATEIRHNIQPQIDIWDHRQSRVIGEMQHDMSVW